MEAFKLEEFGKEIGTLACFFIDCLIICWLWNYLSESGFWPILPSRVQTISYVQAMAMRVLISSLVSHRAQKS